MTIFSNKVVLEVLGKLQTKGKSVIVGGYIRDTLLNVPFNDVDILTTCNFDQIKLLFPNLNWTEAGLSFGVCRTNYKGVSFEFNFVQKDEFLKELLDRDFTINSFYFDGKELNYQATAIEDIEYKTLKPIEPFYKHIEKSPYVILRSFRFASLLGFSFDEKLIKYLTSNKRKLDEVSTTRITEELYKILNGPYVLKALSYMCMTGYLKHNKSLCNINDVKIKNISNSLQARLIYLDHLIGESTITELIKHFSLSDGFLEYINKYKGIFNEKDISNNRKDFPFITILKRYEFNDNKEKMVNFLKDSAKKRSI